MFDYIYTDHAIEQKERRNISDAEVIECINNIETTFYDKKGNPIYRAHISSGRGIKVVVKKENRKVIITVADY